MTEYAIAGENLTMQFGAFRANDDVTLKVPAGEAGRSSARTAPGSPPCSTCWPANCAPRKGR
ncbi:hypothetical protein [Streptodolium elevatio]